MTTDPNTETCTAHIVNEHSGGTHHCVLNAGHRDPDFGTDHAGPVDDEGVRYRWSDHAIGAVPHHSPAASAGLGVSATPSHTGLRDRIAAALYERERPPRDPHWADAFAMDREVFEAMADAVLAVLPPPADRAAVLREAEAKAREVVARLWDDGTTQTAMDRAGGARAVEWEIGLMASGINESAPDFFQPGHSYTHRDGSTFRCVAVTTHPDGGERVAIGWHTDTADWTFVGVRNINHWNHEYDGVEAPADDLRRLADEAQQREREPGCAHCGGDHSWDDCQAYTAVVADEAPQPGPSVHGESVAALAGYQPDGHDTWDGEDSARIDRLRPEFTDHASVESIDAQLRRARAQERRWHIRVEWLISLRADRVAQQERGEWPAVDARQDGAQQS